MVLNDFQETVTGVLPCGLAVLQGHDVYIREVAFPWLSAESVTGLAVTVSPPWAFIAELGQDTPGGEVELCWMSSHGAWGWYQL